MKRAILAIGFFGLVGIQSYAQAPPFMVRAGGNILPLPATYGLIKPENIQRLKSDTKVIQTLLYQLDKNLDYSPSPSVKVSLPPHYNSKGINDEGVEKPFATDARQAYNFALGYAATGNKAYAKTAQKIIDAWANTLVSTDTRQSEDMLNFNMGYMVAAAELTRGEDHWNLTPFKKFLKKVALTASNQANPNNHGLWGVFMEASIYSFLGEQQNLIKIRERWQQHLLHSIDDNGVMENEIQRSGTSNWRGGADKGVKGMAYTHYALTPATLAAVVFENSGLPVWDTPSGNRLARAFHRAATWTRYPETFPYYKSNGGKLDGINNAAYFKILDSHFPDENAQWLLERHMLGGDGFKLLSLF